MKPIFRIPLIQLIAVLLPGTVFLSAGCASVEELEEQNAVLQKRLDSLQQRQYDCVLRNARLAEEIDSLRRVYQALERQPTVTEKRREKTADPSEVPLPVPSAPSGMHHTPSATDLDFQSRYQRALHEFQNKNYQGSLQLFRELSELLPANELTDNCIYWLGECAYALGKYEDAIGRFSSVLEIDASDKRDDALMMRGNTYLKRGEKRMASEDFRLLIERYPESEYVIRAKEKLNALTGY